MNSALEKEVPMLAVRRASPINFKERKLIIEMVKSEPVLANRSTDGIVVRLKKSAWERIAIKFNTVEYGEKRSPYQLQKVWERIKAKAKRDRAGVKQDCRKIGAGLPPPSQDGISQKEISTISTEVDDCGCDFDSDTRRVAPVVKQKEEVQHVVAAAPTSATVTKTLEVPIPEKSPTDSPVLPETSTTIQPVSEEAEGGVQSRLVNTPAIPETPEGAESAAKNLRHQRFGASCPALTEGTLWQKETFSRQQELLEMQKKTEIIKQELLRAQLLEAQSKQETEVIRQELLRAQLSEAQSRARIALLEEETLKNKLG